MSDYFAGDQTPSKLSKARKPKLTKLPDYLGLGFKNTWPVYIVVIACVAAFMAQVLPAFLSFFMQVQVPGISVYDHAFSAEAMRDGRYATIVTSLFLHGGIMHLGFNMWAYVSLANMVYRRFGLTFVGFVGFLTFYILTGIAGNLVFWAMHPESNVPVVGASGAIFGLFGGMIRLNPFSDKPEGLFKPAVLKGWGYFLLSNLLVVVIAGGPLVLLQIAAGQPLQNLMIPIAWEAHLGGFVAGLLLIPLMAGKGWDQAWKTGILQRLEAMRAAKDESEKA